MKKIWSKRHSIRLGENWSYGALRFESLFGVKFPNQFIGYKDGFGHGYVDERMLEECNTHAIAEIYRVGFEDYFEKRARRIFDDFLVFAKGITPPRVAELSDEELEALWKNFIAREDEWMNYVWLVFLLDEALTKELKNKIVKLNMGDVDKLMSSIVAPSEKTAAYLQRIALLEIADKVKQGADVANHIREITEKYAYFSILNMDEEPLGESYFEAEVAKLAEGNPSQELDKIKTEEETLTTEYAAVTEKFASQPAFLRLLEASRKVAFYREYRNDLRQESYYYARHLFIEIARRAKVDIDNLIFATRAELAGFFTSGSFPKIAVLQARKKHSAIVSDYKVGNMSYLFTQEEVEKAWPPENTDANVKEFSGTPAFKGIVRGKVRVVFDASADGGAFQEGEILVATTTYLAFVPFMGKAAAIVTDQGGLLTHTAIVARELRKPCIVGTKIATQVLKDGDMVEVDADKGLVRVIERAEK